MLVLRTSNFQGATNRPIVPLQEHSDYCLYYFYSIPVQRDSWYPYRLGTGLRITLLNCEDNRQTAVVSDLQYTIMPSREEANSQIAL